MYNALGLGWGNSLLASLSVILIPVPMAILVYGEGIRKDARFPHRIRQTLSLDFSFLGLSGRKLSAHV